MNPTVDTAPFPELLAAVPQLADVYAEHIDDNDGVLPHLLMADIGRFLGERLEASLGGEPDPHSAEIVTRILGVLEDALASGDPESRELISASFLENLDPGESYAALKEMLGPHLREQLDVVEEG